MTRARKSGTAASGTRPRRLTRSVVAVLAVSVGASLAAALFASEGGQRALLTGASARAVEPVATTEIWAVGDGADGSAMGRRVGRLIAAARPARLLYLGDVYERGTRWEFEHNYHPAFGALAQRTLPTPGNHEWPRRTEGYRPYWKRITGRRMPSTYAARLGGWEVLSLNSETAAADSPQVRWLRDRVASGGTCRLAFWHRPRYSAGKYPNEPGVEPFWRELRGRAALVVNGHEHNMQELLPRYGIRQLVAGAGGRSHYPVRRDDPRLVWSNAADYGALRIRLRPGVADYAFVRVDGRVLRRGSTTCRP